MRAITLAKVAAAAETLRLRQLARRQATRAVFAAVAGVFALAALVMLHVAAWIGLRHTLSPLLTTLALLAADIVIMAILAVLAFRDTPSAIEREALLIRKQALAELRTSLTLMAMLAEVTNLVLRTGGPRRGIGDVLAEIVTRVLRR